MSTEIKEVNNLIQPLLKTGQNFVSCEYARLLPPGENYGSVMLHVKITVANENNEEEVIDCVAKTCPPTEFLWKMFNTKVTFKKEIDVYNKVFPALNEFGKQNGIDCLIDFFAKCLGARISLNPNSDSVDKDAVLLLENLKVKGYDIGNRHIGFDLECTKLLLRDLAILHAAPIAYKLTKPEDFKIKIRPYLNKGFSFKTDDSIADNYIKDVLKIVASIPKCVPYLSKVKEALSALFKISIENPPEIREHFATFTHNDYWVNNTMIKYENDKPVKNKIVDFQIIEYNSLGRDVVFFLYSSVELSVLENQLDELFRFYYKNFIDTLAKLQCNVSAYPYEAMMEEFAIVAQEEQFAHIILMLPGLMVLKDKAKDLSEIKETDLLEKDFIHENCYKKIEFVITDFLRRGWL